MNFRTKLTAYLSVIFVVFTVLILFFQFQREKEFKRRQLESTLNNITELTHNYITGKSRTNGSDFHIIDSIYSIIPTPHIRITVINPRGEVLYDSEVDDYQTMENHLHRPEVQSSVASEFGANIRKSATTGNSYYYYSKFYSDYFIRTAALYNVDVKEFLQAEKLFIIYIVLLFIIIWVILVFITKQFGDTIIKLKDFTVKLSLADGMSDSPKFQNDELGAISQQIVSAYGELFKARDQVIVEKNKLISHLNALNEGIAFFTSGKEKILTNNRFIQYLNLISDQTSISADKIFDVPILKPILNFINSQLEKPGSPDQSSLPQIDTNHFINDKYFNIRCIFFQDNSFEILIKDTTKLAKRRLLKQQITSNISHELKTPVASVLGYLETLQHHDVEPEQQKHFIKKALAQAKRLSELIEDISTLNKIEETKGHFIFESVNLTDIVKDVYDGMKMKLDENAVEVFLELKDAVFLNGNKSLLSSVFYNLFDNVIKYGGNNIRIKVSNYLEDEDYYYFSFSNTGNEIEEKHLSRIFERFYRVDRGRSRKTGGTGLGLAIVKNVIQFHHGEISVRGMKEGGVEFLFTLAKGRET
ncbi:MAG: two-component sensor histidine kinase [Bacteroidetes bacterium]|nr:two-component sensor histidine kinase [Bacteroidota bacterium]MBT4397885.1 two-component sensor histidine kinase [Bacteroidota bacterium]MBT4411561.1 two-component sensor histidine kinase [Bacteroidota bacterium]MBT7465167.1 two-component sensor histidine kinase [Bacteroidota bacterium]